MKRKSDKTDSENEEFTETVAQLRDQGLTKTEVERRVRNLANLESAFELVFNRMHELKRRLKKQLKSGGEPEYLRKKPWSAQVSG